MYCNEYYVYSKFNNVFYNWHKFNIVLILFVVILVYIYNILLWYTLEEKNECKNKSTYIQPFILVLYGRNPRPSNCISYSKIKHNSFSNLKISFTFYTLAECHYYQFYSSHILQEWKKIYSKQNGYSNIQIICFSKKII